MATTTLCAALAMLAHLAAPAAGPGASGPAPAPAVEVGPRANPGLPAASPARRGRIPMIVGWSVFGGSYLLTATLGVVIHQSTRVCDATGERCRRPGLPLLIPVVGPLFLVRDYAATETGPLFTVATMLIQSAGLAAGIAGTVLYVRDGRRARQPQAGLHIGRGVHLRAAPRLDGGALQLSYRF